VSEFMKSDTESVPEPSGRCGAKARPPIPLPSPRTSRRPPKPGGPSLSSIAAASANGLCRDGRDDDLHQVGVGVIDQTGDEESSRQGPSDDVDVDPDGGVWIADRLGIQLFDRDLEVLGQRLGIVGQTNYWPGRRRSRGARAVAGLPASGRSQRHRRRRGASTNTWDTSWVPGRTIESPRGQRRAVRGSLRCPRSRRGRRNSATTGIARRPGWGGPGFSGHWTKKELTSDRDDDDDAASG